MSFSNTSSLQQIRARVNNTLSHGIQIDMSTERAGVQQRRARADRAQVGEQAQALAQAEQPLLGARGARILGYGRIPLWAPSEPGTSSGVMDPSVFIAMHYSPSG